MIWYLDNSGTPQSTNNSIEIIINELLQRILTWQGEKPFDASDGVDYEAVLNQQAFLKPQIEQIISDYNQYFTSVLVSDPIVNGDKVSINITIQLKNGKTVEITQEVL